MKKLLAVLVMLALCASCSVQPTSTLKPNAQPAPEEEDPPGGGGGEPYWTVGLEKRLYEGDLIQRVCVVIKGPTDMPAPSMLKVRLKYQSILGRCRPRWGDWTWRNDGLTWDQEYQGQWNPVLWSLGHTNVVAWNDTTWEMDHHSQYNQNNQAYAPPVNVGVMCRTGLLAQDYDYQTWLHHGIVKVSIVPDLDTATALPLMLTPGGSRATWVPEYGKDTLTYTFDPSWQMYTSPQEIVFDSQSSVRPKLDKQWHP